MRFGLSRWLVDRGLIGSLLLLLTILSIVNLISVLFTRTAPLPCIVNVLRLCHYSLVLLIVVSAHQRAGWSEGYLMRLVDISFIANCAIVLLQLVQPSPLGDFILLYSPLVQYSWSLKVAIPEG